MPQTIGRVYLDASIMARAVLDKGESKRGRRIFDLQSSSYRIIVPQLVMGKAVTVLMKNGGPSRT